jgi:protein gp37
MGEISNIQWTDSTWNPWIGCHKISPGCKFCYAERWMKRTSTNLHSVGRTSEKTFHSPLTWKESRKIFTCSLSDFFLEVADEWRDEAWEIIEATPRHTFQILTKRPERILNHLPTSWTQGFSHVWVGITAEDGCTLQRRAKAFAKVHSSVRFLSLEPLLSNVSSELKLTVKDFDWVIVGGESGGRGRRRAIDIGWIRGVVNVCQSHNIPVFVKQLGSDLAHRMHLNDWHGGDISEFPRDLRIRQVPRSSVSEESAGENR